MRYLVTFGAASVVLACTVTMQTPSEDASSEPETSNSEVNPRTTSGTSSAQIEDTTSRPASTNVYPEPSSEGVNTTPNESSLPVADASVEPFPPEDGATPGATQQTQDTQESGTTDETSSETPVGCENGPLTEPIPGCAPTFEETGDYYADCVERINQFRWECQCLPPLERYEDAEDCADQQSQYDYEQDTAHAGFSATICEPRGSAQNECPGYGGRFGIVDFCLQQMWDEGPGEDFQAHGHYINMSSLEFSRVACGTYTNPEGEIWAVQNFFR